MRPDVALFLLAALASVTACSTSGAVNEGRRSFAIYDNMSYRGKPNTAPDGLVASNILYEAEIWPHGQNYGVLPSRSEFEALVRSHVANPGPLVLDIEKLPLKGPPEVARHNLEVLATLADWAHQAAPGKAIGYYGTNTLSRVAPPDVSYARELARHVDAFFPSMYTFDDDRAAWASRAQAMTAEAHSLGPGKPVYFYLWPQYHDGTPMQFEFVDAAYWKFQIDTACHDSSGIVLWGPSKFEWNDMTGWWVATRQFARALRTDPGRCPS